MFRGMYTAVLLLAACVAFPHKRAQATERESGLYGSIHVGPAFAGAMNFTEASTADLNLDPKTGWKLGGALGYRFLDNFRVEFDLAYVRNQLRGTFQENVQAFVPCGEFTGNPCLDSAVDGDLSALTAFTAAYYDLPKIGRVKPYVGLGLGLVDFDLGVGTRATLNDGPVSRFMIIDGSNTVLGYRGILGVAYDVGPVDASLGYSYTFANRPSFAGQSPLVSFAFDRKINIHALTAKLTYKF